MIYEAKPIWSLFKQGVDNAAPYFEVCKYLLLSKDWDVSTVARILGKHIWVADNLPFGDDRTHRVDYEGLEIMVQYANEKKKLLRDFYIDFWLELQKREAELLAKFRQDMLDKFNENQKENKQ